jgi:hypothetical protein
MLCLDLEDRAELLAADPDVYYVTDHYVGNAVLVRLSRVNPAVLRDLLGMAYKFVTRNASLPGQRWFLANRRQYGSGADARRGLESLKNRVSGK